MGILAFSATSFSQEISDTKFGKGLINFTAKDSSFSVKFAPRIQARYQTLWVHDGDQYSSPLHNFLIRRSRLKFDGWAYSTKLKYKIEIGLSNRDISGMSEFTRNSPRMLMDAVIMWNFYENFELWAGQTKLPGNVERVISSANLQLVDRSLLNAFFNIDRDMGIQLRHHLQLGSKFVIKEKVALSQGEGRNVTAGNKGGLQYTGRIELLPFGNFVKKGDYSGGDLERETTPKLMLAATYDHNQDAVRTRSNLGSYMFLESGGLYKTDINTVFVDAVFKYAGFSFMGEFADRQAAEPVAIEPNGTPTGDVVLTGSALNLQVGYLFKNNYEIAGRYTTTNFDEITALSGQEQYTLGASRYVVGHKLKVQSDVSYTSTDGNVSGIEFRIGFDLHF